LKKNGLFYVLKIARDSWDVRHLKNECKNLNLAKGIEGVTNLIQEYENFKNYKKPILKEFFDGKEIYLKDPKINKSCIQKKLENTILELHSVGIARLEIESRNIIVSPEKDNAKIIDLGYGRTYFLWKSHLPLSKFNRMKKKDLKNLEEIFEKFR